MISRRRKRSANGTRLGRVLVHIDKGTKELLAEMSKASGVPQIQLVSYAIKTLSQVMKAEAAATEQAEANKTDERSES